MQALEAGKADRWLLRRVQRHTVSVRLRALRPLLSVGDVKELLPGLFLLIDERLYDPALGLLPAGTSGGPALDAASLVA